MVVILVNCPDPSPRIVGCGYQFNLPAGARYRSAAPLRDNSAPSDGVRPVYEVFPCQFRIESLHNRNGRPNRRASYRSSNYTDRDESRYRPNHICPPTCHTKLHGYTYPPSFLLFATRPNTRQQRSHRSCIQRLDAVPYMAICRFCDPAERRHGYELRLSTTASLIVKCASSGRPQSRRSAGLATSRT